MLLPTPEDDLNQTATFPGGFTNVTINYPIQMEAHEQPNVTNALSFNAVMEDGTDDYYSNIMIAFQPISGFDPYMEKGAASAKPYMVKMLDDFMKSMYGSYLLKSFGSDFKDNGDYYSLTGYMWLDGSVFAGDPSQPVRGCMEVRYYGPTPATRSLQRRLPSREGSATTLISATTCSRRSPTPQAGAPRPSPSPRSGLFRRHRRLRYGVLLVRRGWRCLVLERLRKRVHLLRLGRLYRHRFRRVYGKQ